MKAGWRWYVKLPWVSEVSSCLSRQVILEAFRGNFLELVLKSSRRLMDMSFVTASVVLPNDILGILLSRTFV